MANVLIVDDEKSIRLTLGEFLGAAGHETFRADCLAAAEEVLDANEIDVAVVDILLGNESGLDVVRAIRQRSDWIQIILITGEPEVQSAREAIRLQVFDYLAKPVDKDLIVDVVARAAGEKARRDTFHRLQEEQKEREARLRETVKLRTVKLTRSETYYQALLQSAGNLVFIQQYMGAGASGRFLDVNDLTCQRLGYSRTELLEMTPDDVVLPAEHPDFAAEREALNATGQALFEKTLVTKSGEHIPVEINCRIVEIDGQRTAFSIARDISLRRQAAEETRRQRDLAQQYVDVAGVMLIALDRDGVVTLVNPRGCEILGRTRDEIIGHDWFGSFLPAEVQEEVRGVFDHIMGGQLEQLEYYESAIVRPAGEQRQIAWHNSVLHDDAGHIVGTFSSGEDITERRRGEAELQDAQRRQDEAVRAANVGLWDWDLKTDKVQFSDIWKQQIGYAPDEIGDDREEFRSRVHPDDIDRILAAVDRSIAEGLQDHCTEFRFRHKDGSYRWILAQASVINDDDGNPLRMRGSHIDITRNKRREEELHRAEEELRRSQSLLAETQGLANFGGWEHDLRTGKATWTRALYDIIELPYDQEPPGVDEHLGYYPEPDRSVLEEAYRRAIEEGESFDLELQVNTASARRIWCRARGKAISENGKCIGLFGTFQDITDRRAREAELQRSREKYRAMVDNIGIGVALIDPDMRIIELNRQMRAWFPRINVEEKPICHCSFNDPPRPQVCDYCPTVKTLAGGQVYEATSTTPTPDGIRNYRIVSSPVHDAQGRVISAIEMVEDVTDKLSLEVQVRQAQKLESLGTLAGGVAHEINNPINGIMNYAQLIMDHAPDPNAEAVEFATEIISETERVAELVRDLLAFARQDEQVRSLARPTDIIARALSLMRTVLRHDQIQLSIEVPEDLPEIHCHSQQLQQVLVNLMANARDALNERFPKYAPRKEVLVKACIHNANGNRCLRFTVEDHGGGIPEAVQKRMFDPFFTTKPRDRGTGLGLAISYGIVEDHGGRLHCETEPGECTRFHLDLPLQF